MSNDKYELLAQQLQALIEGGPDLIANLSNASAAINEALGNINWAGFYLVKENMLVLGPKGRGFLIKSVKINDQS